MKTIQLLLLFPVEDKDAPGYSYFAIKNFKKALQLDMDEYYSLIEYVKKELTVLEKTTVSN